MEYKPKISIIGLGYVGLPVAMHLSKVFEVVGFDINSNRIETLKSGTDYTQEMTDDEIKKSSIHFTNDEKHLADSQFYIVTVPTPIDNSKKPDLTPLFSATKTIGKYLKKDDIVVYESTVYPGVTEDECMPILEQISNLKGGVDFKVGYSPERINPGDKINTFENIVKVISAQDDDSLNKVEHVYSSVLKKGIYRAKSIKVAEAAKVIENTQRDVNIALMNELSIIFDKLDIDTHDVLDAAKTKWNFINFIPGLVGGHCIGVDPYYLTHKAMELNYHPEVILAGRRINDNMPRFVVEKLLKKMVLAGLDFKNCSVNIYGLTFKENCTDIRNSKVFDIINELGEYNIKVNVCDPKVAAMKTKETENIKFFNLTDPPKASASIIAVAHSDFMILKEENFNSNLVLDLKSILPEFKTKELFKI